MIITQKLFFRKYFGFKGNLRILQIMAVFRTLIEEADISYYGSKIGLLNGQTGRWLTNISSDIVQLYQELDNDNNTCTWVQILPKRQM